MVEQTVDRGADRGAHRGAGGPLRGITVAEIGDGLGVSIAGLLLGELGAQVVKLTEERGSDAGEFHILNRGKELRPQDEASRRRVVKDADLVLVERPWDLDLLAGPAAPTVPVVRFLDGRGGSAELLSPTETLLAEAASGILCLQLGHRDGPFCLASPIAGYGAGVLGALSAACGLLAGARGATVPWRGQVSYLDGALAFQTLSASFVRDLAAAPPRRRYQDPYSVSFSPLLRFHRARDGWVFIGAISEHMWVTLFSMIGRPDLLSHVDLVGVLPFNISNQAAGDEVARAIGEFVSTRGVQECVDLLTERGVVVAPVLSNTQFLDHPQAEANGLRLGVADAEAGEQLQVGNFLGFTEAGPGAGAAAPLPGLDSTAGLPLRGIRVLDVARHAAGPICGRVWADLGADVVRIEAPEGDTSRAIGMTFAATNRGKLSFGLDIRHRDGRAVLDQLVASVDIVLTNALPDAARRLGIDWATVSSANPDASVVTILGFGRNPPFGGRRVVDAAAQALSGQALAEGGGSEPVGCTGGFLDNGAGWLAALAGVAALYRRQVTGAASAAETSLLNTSAFIQMHRMARPARSTAPALDPDRLGYSWAQRLYRVAEGWICVAANDAPQRRALAAFARSAGVEVESAGPGSGLEQPGLAAAFAAMTSVEVAHRLAAAGMSAWAPVQTLEDVARSRSDLFVALPQEPWEAVLQPRRLPDFAQDADHALRGAPSRPGEHNDRVYAMFGLDPTQRARLIEAGVMLREPPVVASMPTSV